MNNESDNEAHNKPVVVRELTGSEESINLGGLDTIYENSDEDTGDYTSTRSRARNGATEGYSPDKKTLAPSGSMKSPSNYVKAESVYLRQNYPSFGRLFVGEDEEMESPKRKSQSSYGETDGGDMTETLSQLSAVQKHKETVNDQSEQNQPILASSKSGRYEHLVSRPGLLKSFERKIRDWTNLRTPKHSDARFL